MAYTLNYTLINNDAEYAVSGYTGEPINISIPSECNGKPVTSIGENAFFNCHSLTSVVIPNSVTSIGDYAFYDCISLMNVVIPNSVTTIYSYAFYGCSSLTSVVMPDSVTEIGSGAFYGCSGLTSIKIPDGVKDIIASTFYNCSSLTSVVIPDSVTMIGIAAFWNCTNLTSVEIPDSVTNIGISAFYNCSSLTSITLLSKTPASVDSTSFGNISANTKFYCHSSAIDAYKTATNWNTYADKFIADDMRLYFTMNARAQKKYFANKEQIETLSVDLKSYVQKYIHDNFATLMKEYLENNEPTAEDISEIFTQEA